jgi:hypothetical protein
MSVRMADGSFVSVKAITKEQSENIGNMMRYAGIYCALPRTGSPNNLNQDKCSVNANNSGSTHLNAYGSNAFSSTSGFQKIK